MGLACVPQGAAAASPNQGLSCVPLKHFRPLKPQLLLRFSPATTQQRLQWQTGDPAGLEEAGKRCSDIPGSGGALWSGWPRADGCGSPASTGSTISPVSLNVHTHSWFYSSTTTSPCAQTQPHKSNAGCLSSCHSTAQRSAGSPYIPPSPGSLCFGPCIPEETSPTLQICWCSPPETISSDSAPIAMRFLSMQGLPLPSCTFAQSLKSVQIIPSLLLCNFPSPTLLLLSPSQQAQPRRVINTCHFVCNLLQEE